MSVSAKTVRRPNKDPKLTNTKTQRVLNNFPNEFQENTGSWMKPRCQFRI